MRQTESVRPLWTSKLWGILLLAVHFKKIAIQYGFQLPVSGSEETPSMLFFFFFKMHLFPPFVCSWRMKLFTFPWPLQLPVGFFSLLSLLPALNLCPCKAPSPVSYLKVMSSDLAGAEENVPNS